MGIAARVSGAVLGVVAVAAAGPAAAWQDHPAAGVSPYSLSLDAERAPAAAACPATRLYCAGSEGLNLSVVGRAHLASSLGLFGKVGAVSARPDTATMGIGAATLSDPSNSGLSWGGGLSWEFTPRLSATFEWLSYELRTPGPGGALRTTSLGLKYRY